MSFHKNIFSNLSKHYIFSYFFNQKRENRLVITVALSLFFIILIHLSNILMQSMIDNRNINGEIVDHAILTSSHSIKKIYSTYSAQDFLHNITKSNIDMLSVQQIYDFITQNEIINVKIYHNDINKYEFINQAEKFTLIYDRGYGWVFKNAQATINFKVFNKDFHQNVHILSHYNQNTQDISCKVKSENGFTLQAVDDCYIKMNDNKTLMVKYLNLKNSKNHPVMMLLSFNQSTNLQSKDHQQQNNQYIFVKRGDAIAHMPHQTIFSIKLISKIDARLPMNPMSSYMHLDLKNKIS